MPSNDPTQPGPASRYAVPVADLDAVHISQAQMVALSSSSQRMPDHARPPTLADADADGGGGGGD